MNMLKQVPGARKGFERRQVALHEDLLPPLADLLALLTIFGNAYRLWQDLISPHTNQGANLIEGDIIAILVHRLYPGMGMRVIAVHQRSIDVKDDAANMYNHTIPFFCDI